MDHSSHLHHLHHLLGRGLDPLAWAGFVAIFSFSVMASLHCAAMCAPLACALLGKGGSVGRPGLWLYNLGRFTSYVGAGTLLGATGGALLDLSAPLGKAFAVLLALALLAAAALTIAGKERLASAPGARIARTLALPLGRAARKLPAPLAPLGLGLITVLLPCMTLTPVLGLAAASGSALTGAATLVAFHLGTVPVMVIAPSVPTRLAGYARPAAAARIAGVFLLIAGFTTLYRVLH